MQSVAREQFLIYYNVLSPIFVAVCLSILGLRMERCVCSDCSVDRIDLSCDDLFPSEMQTIGRLRVHTGCCVCLCGGGPMSTGDPADIGIFVLSWHRSVSHWSQFAPDHLYYSSSSSCCCCHFEYRRSISTYSTASSTIPTTDD